MLQTCRGWVDLVDLERLLQKHFRLWFILMKDFFISFGINICKKTSECTKKSILCNGIKSHHLSRGFVHEIWKHWIEDSNLTLFPSQDNNNKWEEKVLIKRNFYFALTSGKKFDLWEGRKWSDIQKCWDCWLPSARRHEFQSTMWCVFATNLLAAGWKAVPQKRTWGCCLTDG